MGIELDELIALLMTNHEIEFSWNGNSYMIQSEDGKFVMYQFEPEMKYIYNGMGSVDNTITNEMVLDLLKSDVLDGKSFIDRVDELQVVAIY